MWILKLMEASSGFSAKVSCQSPLPGTLNLSPVEWRLRVWVCVCVFCVQHDMLWNHFLFSQQEERLGEMSLSPQLLSFPHWWSTLLFQFSPSRWADYRTDKGDSGWSRIRVLPCHHQPLYSFTLGPSPSFPRAATKHWQTLHKVEKGSLARHSVAHL